jgi:hypothetical protein
MPTHAKDAVFSLETKDAVFLLETKDGIVFHIYIFSFRCRQRGLGATPASRHGGTIQKVEDAILKPR